MNGKDIISFLTALTITANAADKLQAQEDIQEGLAQKFLKGCYIDFENLYQHGISLMKKSNATEQDLLEAKTAFEMVQNQSFDSSLKMYCSKIQEEIMTMLQKECYENNEKNLQEWTDLYPLASDAALARVGLLTYPLTPTQQKTLNERTKKYSKKKDKEKTLPLGTGGKIEIGELTKNYNEVNKKLEAIQSQKVKEQKQKEIDVFKECVSKQINAKFPQKDVDDRIRKHLTERIRSKKGCCE